MKGYAPFPVFAFLLENLISRPRAYPLFLLPRRGREAAAKYGAERYKYIKPSGLAIFREIPEAYIYPPRFRICAMPLCERPPVDLLIWRSIGSWLPAINFLCTPLHIKSVFTSPIANAVRSMTQEPHDRFLGISLPYFPSRVLSSKKKSRISIIKK